MNNKENNPYYDPRQEIDTFFRPQEGMIPFAIYSIRRGIIVRKFRKLPDPLLAVPSDTWNIVQISKIQVRNKYTIQMDNGKVDWKMVPNQVIRRAQRTLHIFYIDGTAEEHFQKIMNYISIRTISINSLCFKGTPPVTEMIKPFQPDTLSVWMNFMRVPMDLCFSFVDESKVNYVAIRDHKRNLGNYLDFPKLANYEVMLLLRVVNYKALSRLKSNNIFIDMEETSHLDVNGYVELVKIFLAERPVGFVFDIGKFDNLQESFLEILSMDGWSQRRYLNTDCAMFDGPIAKALMYVDEQNIRMAVTPLDLRCPDD